MMERLFYLSQYCNIEIKNVGDDKMEFLLLPIGNDQYCFSPKEVSEILGLLNEENTTLTAKGTSTIRTLNIIEVVAIYDNKEYSVTQIELVAGE